MATGILGAPIFVQALVRWLNLWASRHGVTDKCEGLATGAALWKKLLQKYGVSHLTIGPDDNVYISNARMASTLALHKNDIKDFLFGAEVPLADEPDEPEAVQAQAVQDTPALINVKPLPPASAPAQEPDILDKAKNLVARIDENRYGIKNPTQLVPIKQTMKAKKAKKGKGK